MARKAQVAVEVMSYYALLLLVFLVTLFLIVNNQRSVNEERINMDAQRLLMLSKNEIDIAAKVGDGYSNSFVLPGALEGGANYTMAVNTYFQQVYIEYNQQNVSLPLLTSNITGTFGKGTITIRNSGGMIILA